MKNGKIFGIIHIMDILWGFLLAALIFGAMQFSVPRQVNARTGDVLLRYTIELGGRRTEEGVLRLAHEGFHKNVRVGETLFDGLRGQEIGQIVDVYARPFQIEAFDKTYGVFRQAEVEGLEYVYIVVEALAQVSDYETLIGQFPASVGRVVFVMSRYFAGEGFITSIEWLD